MARMTYEEKEEILRRHAEREGPGLHDIHPDGCFYCGGNHLSDCCPDERAKDEWWGE